MCRRGGGPDVAEARAPRSMSAKVGERRRKGRVWGRGSVPPLRLVRGLGRGVHRYEAVARARGLADAAVGLVERVEQRDVGVAVGALAQRRLRAADRGAALAAELAVDVEVAVAAAVQRLLEPRAVG